MNLHPNSQLKKMLQESEYMEDGRIFHGLAPRVMGSKLDLMAVDVDRETSDAFWKEICAEAEKLEAMLNSDDKNSEIGQFNAGKMLAHSEISEELGEIIEICKEYKFRTCNAFDVALGKMSLVDHDEEDGTLSVYGARVDFGSFAKGYLTKKIEAILRGKGVNCALVNFGNSLFLAIGKHPYGDSWKISLNNPFTRMPVEEMKIKDGTLAFSCNAPGCTGRVINPKTGEGVENRIMTVVTAPDALDAKVLSTALMVTGPEKIESLKEEFPEAEMVIYNL